MIILCSKCMRGMRVVGDQDEAQHLIGDGSEYWPDKYPCFNCDNTGAHAHLEPSLGSDVLQAADIVNVDPQEAFAALNGLGIPSERNCCKEVLDEILQKCNISVHGKQHRGSMLFYIEYLETDSGTRIYFATSPGGAVIYRIRPPHSYVESA